MHPWEGVPPPGGAHRDQGLVMPFPQFPILFIEIRSLTMEFVDTSRLVQGLFHLCNPIV